MAISRGSTLRSEFLPTGCPCSLAVYKANKGICRLDWGDQTLSLDVSTTYSLVGIIAVITAVRILGQYLKQDLLVVGMDYLSKVIIFVTTRV